MSDVGSMEPDERVGTVLADRYRIDALLGEGGMGKVYSAEHVLMRKRVAVKVLHSDLTQVPEVVTRFEREAMAAANIEHPNVAAATDFGKLPDGSVFLVLEFVQGTNLRDEIGKGAMSVERALNIGRQIAGALAAAHALEIVHRDLKPENVMLIEKGGESDFVKVLDFGIARVPMGESAQTPGQLTKAGVVFGTPEYMSPEQALGQRVDGRADLYALGVILYELISGVRPFSSKSQVGILGQQLSNKIPAFHERAPGLAVPPQVEALTVKLLAKDVATRFQKATEVVAVMDALLMPVAGQGAHRFTMKGGSPSSVLEARAASVPDLQPPVLGDLEEKAEALDSLPFVTALPLEELSADAELPSAPVAAPAAAPVAAPVAKLERARWRLAFDNARAHARSVIHEAYELIDARRAKLPPTVRDLLRDVPSPGLLWTAVGVLAVGAIGMGVLLGSVSGRKPASDVPVVTARSDAPPADSASPAPVAKLAAEIAEAKKQGATGLAELAEQHPSDADVQIELASAYSAEAKHRDAVGAVGKALGLDPERAGDERLASVLRAAARTRTAADASFALLEGPMGSHGADLIFELAQSDDAKPDLRARAERVMATQRFGQAASPALGVALQLRQAKNCQQRYAHLLRAKQVGDGRALELLRRFEKTVDCAGVAKRDCNACMAADARLKQAIQAIEKRAGS
jgi:eukaryotic-like serine/threonine-protein kinase